MLADLKDKFGGRFPHHQGNGHERLANGIDSAAAELCASMFAQVH